MSEPVFNDEASREARRFRLVTTDDRSLADSAKSPAEGRATETTADAITSMVPSRLLVDQSAWQEVAGRRSSDQMLAQATIPLLGSLARIRSEADAALALTGVLEGLVRRFHVTPPCTLTDETTVTFVAPASMDLTEAAQMIDDALVGQVRATDLQGALRQRLEATIEAIEPNE